MNKVNALVVSAVGNIRDLDAIAAVDPCISVKDGRLQFLAELRRKGKKGPLVDILEAEETKLERDPQAAEAQEDLDTLLAQAEVIYGVALFPDELLSRAPRLKWVHIGSTAINVYQSTDIFESNITITNSRGATAVGIAEHVLTFMLMLAKDAPHLVVNKQTRRWERSITTELDQKTVGLIGLGAIGSEVAKRAKCMGMKVIATKRSTTKRESGVLGVDELYPRSDLRQILSESDFVVIAVPLTAETTGMLGEEELRAMRPSAYLINVSRGQVVDQSALIEALEEKRIAGAGLDVFETEPLPADSELWELPNVILSSHIAGSTDKRGQRLIDLFCENLRRYLASEEMLNVIDRKKRY